MLATMKGCVTVLDRYNEPLQGVYVTFEQGTWQKNVFTNSSGDAILNETRSVSTYDLNPAKVTIDGNGYGKVIVETTITWDEVEGEGTFDLVRMNLHKTQKRFSGNMEVTTCNGFAPVGIAFADVTFMVGAWYGTAVTNITDGWATLISNCVFPQSPDFGYFKIKAVGFGTVKVKSKIAPPHWTNFGSFVNHTTRLAKG